MSSKEPQPLPETIQEAIRISEERARRLALCMFRHFVTSGAAPIEMTSSNHSCDMATSRTMSDK